MLIKFFLNFYRFFCSLKMAVCTLSALILLFTLGTIFESLYGREAAGEMVYQSFWMTSLLVILFLNILAVMIDRWPWGKKHIPFLCAHFGILFIITGSFLTRFYGADGVLRLEPGQTKGQISLTSRMFIVYSSFDGENLTELAREEVSFLKNPPSPQKPYKIPLGSKVLKIINFYPFSLAKEHYKVPPKKGRAGEALRFQIEGAQASFVKWIFKSPLVDKALFDMGQAKIFLTISFSAVKDIKKPSLLLKPQGNVLKYRLINPNKKQTVREGTLKIGSVLNTGWMDFRFKVLSYMPRSLPDIQFLPQEKTSERSIPAVHVSFNGESQWMGLNSHLFFFDEDKVFITAYVNTRRALNFDVTLKDFKIIRYPASLKALSYESTVQINKKEYLISMNEPLQFKGWTVYQSGFEEDELGNVKASLFSVNKDPGRFLKYFGSLLVVLGSLLLFIKRNRRGK